MFLKLCGLKYGSPALGTRCENFPLLVKHYSSAPDPVPQPRIGGRFPADTIPSAATESGRVAFQYLTVDSDTLDIEFTNDTSSGVVIPVRSQSSKMWEAVYFQFYVTSATAVGRVK